MGRLASRAGPRDRSLAYLPGVEGLRAVAVLAVLVYHANAGALPGGFLGVDVFFVISGFLITSLLLAEHERTGRLDLKRFWLRRARRLLPALYLLLLVCITYAVLFLPGEVARLRTDALAALGYVTNWYLVLGHQSYFQVVGRPSLFQHLWSLAVEEQFYILWPVVLTLLLPRARRYLPLAVLAAAVASTVLMAVLYQPTQDPSRVYFGTDTRSMGLLLGALLAFGWGPLRRGRTQPESVVRSIEIAGAAGAAGLVVCLWTLGEQQPFLFRSGFFVASFCALLLVAAAAHPQARVLPRVLGVAPLRWLGARSYGIYLWHWPVMAVTRPDVDVHLNGALLAFLQVLASVALAALSYRYVEAPVRSGALGRLWDRWRAARRAPGRRAEALGASTAAACLVGLLTLSALVAQARPAEQPDYLKITAVHGRLSSPSPGASASPAAAGRGVQPAPAPATPAPPPQESRLPPGCPPPAAPGQVSAVGDSVMLGAAPELAAALPGIDLDAEVSRQAEPAIDALRAKQAARTLGATVVVHIGDNGFLTDPQLQELMTTLRCAHRVVLVNDKVPREWEDANDGILQSAARRYPNVTLVDWRAASTPHPEWFYPDGIHLRQDGATTYAQLIAQAVHAS